MSTRTGISEAIQEGLRHEEFLSACSDFEKTLSVDERLYVKETKGLRAFWAARGGYIEPSTLGENVMELPRATIGYHVVEHSTRIESDPRGPEDDRLAAKIVPAAIKAVHKAVANRVVALLQASCPLGYPSSVDRLASLAPMSESIAARGKTPVSVGWLNGPCHMREMAEQVWLDSMIDRDDLSEDEAGSLPVDEVFLYAKEDFTSGQFGPLGTKEWDGDDWYWHVLGRIDFGAIITRSPLRYRSALVAA